MGGGGSYYDRDTSDGYARDTRTGVSRQTEQMMNQSRVDAALLPLNRRLSTNAASPVAFVFDDTGSMDNLPKIICDKMPLVAGQLAKNDYLKDPEMSLAAIGDIESDQAPIQVCDFSSIKLLDDWLRRIWLEKGGGGQGEESYEFAAYFYSRYCDMPKAKTPFLIFTGDEDFRDTLYVNDLKLRFGGDHARVDAAAVFEDLKKKFKGNVFLVHRRYHDSRDDYIVSHWQSVLGAERVLRLGSDQAIADVTLGIFAVMTGARTLDEYLKDMRTERDRAQTEDRISEVRATLSPLLNLPRPKRQSEDRQQAAAKESTPASKKKPTESIKGGKKPYRL